MKHEQPAASKSTSASLDSVICSQVLVSRSRLLRLDYRSGVDDFQDWALISPPETGDKWVVCIHGHGAQGDQLYARADIRECWLPCFKGHGFGVLTPNLRGNAWMGPAAVTDIGGLLSYMLHEFGARRFVFASGSMGGTSNLIYAGLRPEDVAGVIALGAATDPASYYAWCRERNSSIIKEIADAIEASYGGSPDEIPDVYHAHSVLVNAGRLKMPVFAAHGSLDSIIPVSQMRSLAGKMGDADNFVYADVPDEEHDSPIPLMSDALDWLTRRIQCEFGSGGS